MADRDEVRAAISDEVAAGAARLRRELEPSPEQAQRSADLAIQAARAALDRVALGAAQVAAVASSAASDDGRCVPSASVTARLAPVMGAPPEIVGRLPLGERASMHAAALRHAESAEAAGRLGDAEAWRAAARRLV